MRIGFESTYNKLSSPLPSYRGIFTLGVLIPGSFPVGDKIVKMITINSVNIKGGATGGGSSFDSLFPHKSIAITYGLHACISINK